MNSSSSAATASTGVTAATGSPIVTLTDCSIHPLYLEVECSQDFKSFQSWCLSHPHLPIYAVVVYVAAIFAGCAWMRSRPACNLRRPLFLWNAGLALFSIAGTIRTGTELVHVLNTAGFYGSICFPIVDNVTSLWRFAFVLSKFAELLDTYFIVARKKPLLFLHWYHHVTVLLFTWDTHVRDGSSSRYFVCINFLVHSIMYSYYALMARGFKGIASVSIAITSLQIVQMGIGMFVLLRVHSFLGSGDRCSDSAFTVLTGLLMYASYFILFAHFFLKRYVFPSGDKARQRKAL